MKVKTDEFVEAAGDVLEDAVEVVTKNKLFTPKRIAIAAGVVVATAAAVLIVKKVRSKRAELEVE